MAFSVGWDMVHEIVEGGMRYEISGMGVEHETQKLQDHSDKPDPTNPSTCKPTQISTVSLVPTNLRSSLSHRLLLRPRPPYLVLRRLFALIYVQARPTLSDSTTRASQVEPCQT